MYDLIHQWLMDNGIVPIPALIVSYLILVIAVISISYVANYITKKLVLKMFFKIIKKSQSQWDDELVKTNLFHYLSNFVPVLIIYISAPLFPHISEWIYRLANGFMIVLGLLVIQAFLNASVNIYNTYEISKLRPIRGYVQVIKIFISVIAVVFILAILTDSSPYKFLGSIGAFTAILILVFKDTILGLIASISISMNHMVQIGDWVEMPKYNADGDVLDITLHTVKVQNWDKTISTIPTYAFLSDSFKNWRGMKESGGRRIKRSINIDINSIKFCDEQMLDQFEKFATIHEYIQTKRKEIEKFNQGNEAESSVIINRRSLTNIGTFRAYIKNYLRKHPKINQNLTFLIRQLPPGTSGLPIEIYVFTSDTEWANYEAIQADIFDHLLAIAPEFKLNVFQSPSGQDIKLMTQQI